MTDDRESSLGLAQEFLRLYKLALMPGHAEVADHLLCALEQLAKADPACQSTLDQAYLWVEHGPQGRCSATRARRLHA